ncbi:type IX secretion system membrane protein, PorP/SprF family [Filimonas lacunae]|uniref:Type IX secretion system membrane protein, PorP/SprF family n=1 Tax=Filimonas lacunae TaxID=477680 RepID=A0A173MF10_9BACT|nr:PorP/SprF family type IX secretion system membrane protein [Filimonas lacunae]BAV06155.1 hypothetical protein FLA_2171 [Filimonas lacunae]SIT24970.1 type IX secretion system membrane protein, PorP/SprF family [Filimonas lacunae]
MKKQFIGLTIVCSVLFAHSGKAQLYYNNAVAHYYRNNYLANPAYAGAHDNPFVYALANRSWIGFDGAPTLMQLTGDMGFGKNSAAGLQLTNDKSGVLRRTSAKVSYGYKIKLSGKEQIRLGFSLATYKQQLDGAAIIDGGAVDNGAKQFNQKGWQVDGDFGAVYELKGFSFSATGFNLRQWFPKVTGNDIDMETMNVMTSYAWKPEGNNEYEIKPLLSGRFFTKRSWILAAGTQFTYDQTFHASAIWQNTGSICGTLGLLLKNFGELNLSYVSNNKQGYGQQYEVGVGIGLKSKKENAE